MVLVAYTKSDRTWWSAMISHIAPQKFRIPANELVTSSQFGWGYPHLPRFFLTADNFAPASINKQALLGLYPSQHQGSVLNRGCSRGAQ